MFLSGVNRVFFHGSTYSPKEAPWPGWKFYASVDMSPTNTIWKDAPSFFTYIARVQSFLQSGEPDNDFLLYLPMHDIWAGQRGNYYTTFSIHWLREMLPDFCNVVDLIMERGFNLDYISDRLLQSTTFEGGLLKTKGGATYKALIFPSVKHIPLETLEQVKKLTEQGATVIFAEQYPSDVPGLSLLEERRGRLNDLLVEFPEVGSFEQVNRGSLGKGEVITGSGYSEILNFWTGDSEPFVTNQEGQLVRRKHENGHIYFLTMLRNNPVDGWVGLGVDAESALFFDPMSGKVGEAKLRDNYNKKEVYLQLDPGESIILKTFNYPVEAAEWAYLKPTGGVIELNSGWTLRFIDSDPPVEGSFDIGSLSSWSNTDHAGLKINMGTGIYSKTFQFKKKPGSQYLLSLGDVRESARVTINGKEAGTLFAVPFETGIGHLLRDGENTIEIAVTNLPANRIADYDRRGVEWRKFHDINFISVSYGASIFSNWDIVPSGLLGPVTIQEQVIQH